MDAPQPTNPIVDYFSKWSPLLLLLLGGLLTQLWNRFRTRMRRFTWRAWHNRVAISGNDPHWGNVTVQYNNVPVNQLHMTTVHFVNDSSEDQRDVKVTLFFEDGRGQIIGSQGSIQGSAAGSIPVDQDYLDLFQAATPEQVSALAARVVHKIPVLNRGQRAIFTMLVARDDNSTPAVQVSCEHPGFKLDFLPTGPEIQGVPYNLALAVGSIVSLVMVLLAVRYQRPPHPYLTALLAWFLGIYVATIGADLVRLWKTAIRMLG